MCVYLYQVVGPSRKKGTLHPWPSVTGVCAHQNTDGGTLTAQSDTTHKQLQQIFFNKYKIIILRLLYKSEPTIQQYVNTFFK